LPVEKFTLILPEYNVALVFIIKQTLGIDFIALGTILFYCTTLNLC